MVMKPSGNCLIVWRNHKQLRNKQLAKILDGRTRCPNCNTKKTLKVPDEIELSFA